MENDSDPSYESRSPSRSSSISVVELNNDPVTRARPESVPVPRQTNRKKYKYQLVFSIVNAIIFFPLIFFWIPALVCSLKARKSFKAVAPVADQTNERERNTKLIKIARTMNIICLLIGKFTLLIFQTKKKVFI